jgi:glycosyltransferase involved in cell wall biosynthesis
MTRLLIVTTVEATLRGFLAPYARHFRDLGWRVDGMAKGASGSPECLAAFDACYEAVWSRNPLNPWSALRMPGLLRRRVAAGAYDLVHVHTPVAAFLTRFALRNLPGPGRPKVVYTAHGFHFEAHRKDLPNAVYAGLEKLAGAWTDRLVVINRADEKEALRRGIVDRARLTYMPGIGLDLSYYDPARIPPGQVAGVRTELGLAPGQPLFLMVANFDPGKRHQDLLAAFEALDAPDAHLALAGGGARAEGFRRWCRERGLDGRVHFLGYRRDIPALMRASLAMVHPSQREGLPRSVMEAMALGVPVIGTDIRGTADLLALGGGLKVRVGDVAALKAAMERLIRDPGHARTLGEEARPRMQDFDLPNLFRLHEALYAEVLATRPPVQAA